MDQQLPTAPTPRRVSWRSLDRETLQVLREPPFRAYIVSRACSGIANNLFQAAILWQIYELTGSALQLGIVGLVRFVPIVAFNLLGGAVADTYNRRTILLLAQSALLVAGLGILSSTVLGTVSLPVLYGLTFLAGVASSFESPARQGLIPALVPRPLYRAAIVVNQTVQASASVTGPALAGVLIAVGGTATAYGAYVGLVVTSLVALLMIPAPLTRLASSRGVSLAAIQEGLVFVWRQKVVLGAMTLDLVAVVFGGAKALLPIYAVDILHAGPTGYGVLSAASEAGALLCAVALLLVRQPARAGWGMLISIAVYGVVTILFGISTSLPLAVLFYALTGAADQVSVVIRHTLIQLSTPDELRGRVTSVNSIFTQSSVHLGAVESGFVAAATSAVFAVVSGGAVVLLVVALLAWWLPELRSYRVIAGAAHTDRRLGKVAA